MKDNSNKKLIVIGVLILVCMFSFYKVVTYYQGKDYEPIVRDVNDDSNNEVNVADEEVNIGKRVGCAVKNYAACGCTSIPASDTNSKRYCENQCNLCTKCAVGVDLIGGGCYQKSCTATGTVVPRVSQGEKVGTITVTNCPNEPTVTCSNCSASKSSCGTGCWTFTATASSSGCNATGNFTTSAGGGGSFTIKPSWGSASGTVKDSGNEPTSPAKANEDNKDYWVKDCNGTTCTVVQKRGTSCGGSNDTPVEQTDPNKYSYCCVKYDANDGSPYEFGGYKKNQDDKNQCGEGFTADENRSEENCKYNYCCVKRENGTIKEYHSYHYDEKNYSQCPSGYSADSGISKDDCKVETEKSCYGNRKYLSIATDVKWQAEASSGLPYKISGIDDEFSCKVLKDPSSCVPRPLAVTPINAEADICEDNVHLNLVDGVSCSGKSFYNIECVTDSVVSFDNGNDEGSIKTVNSILIGQGFKYGIKLTTIKKCTAVFNGENWRTSYSRARKKIKQADSDLQKSGMSSTDRRDIESEKAWNEEKLSILEGMLEAYNKTNPASLSSDDEIATFTMNYSVSNKNKELNADFEKKVIQKGKGKYYEREEVEIYVNGFQNPYNYTWNNVDNPRIVKFVPVKTYINGLDGGNKIYIDYDTDPGTYTMDINVSNIAGKNSVHNDKCQLRVSKEGILYRPIDVSNPFINNTWQPGANWINSEMDFRNIIHANIWSK